MISPIDKVDGTDHFRDPKTARSFPKSSIITIKKSVESFPVIGGIIINNYKFAA
jgi:hypothetical protein